MASSAPASRVSRRSSSWKPGSGSRNPTLVIAGSARTSATSPGASAACTAATSLKATTRAWVVIHGGRPRLSGTISPPLGDDERRVALAVVLAVEQQHDLPPGELAGETDDLGVGLGRRRGELPLRQPVAVGEVLGDGDRVLAGQQELVSEAHPASHRLGHGRRRVAAERAHVGHVHVEVGVPVDVGEARAGAARDPDRRVVVEVVHPRHRHAARHRAARLLLQRHGPRPLGDEARVLRLRERLHARRVDAGRVGCCHPGRVSPAASSAR